ncbi:MAG: hypothetical protein ACK48V_10125 [Crocinitomicaceae bacterium]|jgi:hypothetical protein
MPAWIVIYTLNQVIEKNVKQSGIGTDNCPKFTPHSFQNWLEETKIELV